MLSRHGFKQVFKWFTSAIDEDKILPEIKLNDKLPVR